VKLLLVLIYLQTQTSAPPPHHQTSSFWAAAQAVCERTLGDLPQTCSPTVTKTMDNGIGFLCYWDCANERKDWELNRIVLRRRKKELPQ